MAAIMSPDVPDKTSGLFGVPVVLTSTSFSMRQLTLSMLPMAQASRKCIRSLGAELSLVTSLLLKLA